MGVLQSPVPNVRAQRLDNGKALRTLNIRKSCRAPASPASTVRTMRPCQAKRHVGEWTSASNCTSRSHQERQPTRPNDEIFPHPPAAQPRQITRGSPPGVQVSTVLCPSVHGPAMISIGSMPAHTRLGSNHERAVGGRDRPVELKERPLRPVVRLGILVSPSLAPSPRPPFSAVELLLVQMILPLDHLVLRL